MLTGRILIVVSLQKVSKNDHEEPWSVAQNYHVQDCDGCLICASLLAAQER